MNQTLVLWSLKSSLLPKYVTPLSVEMKNVQGRSVEPHRSSAEAITRRERSFCEALFGC